MGAIVVAACLVGSCAGQITTFGTFVNIFAFSQGFVPNPSVTGTATFITAFGIVAGSYRSGRATGLCVIPCFTFINVTTFITITFIPGQTFTFIGGPHIGALGIGRTQWRFGVWWNQIAQGVIDANTKCIKRRWKWWEWFIETRITGWARTIGIGHVHFSGSITDGIIATEISTIHIATRSEVFLCPTI